MKRILIHLLIAPLMMGCFSSGKQQSHLPQPIEPTRYTYEVVAEYPHLRDSYTQGLLFHEGELWEGTGQEGASRLLRYRPLESSPTVIATLPRHEFGEGIALLEGELFFLTWLNNTVHIFDPKSGAQKRTLHYTGEGWGLTSDGEKLYFSNGSSTIYILDPQTFKRERSIPITLRGEPLEWINELEWIDGKIWANIYTSNHIAIINPKTGVVEGLVDLSGVLPKSEREASTDVLNGIAYDPTTKRIFITGKNWPKLYEITLRNE